ncbi:protein sieve element occlusion b [Quercus suber]|uniref:Protein sieve element occlusion b n=1 Tax=Quercus suber TaxID=58331 RepID=A0AAW0LTS2_QUESU
MLERTQWWSEASFRSLFLNVLRIKQEKYILFYGGKDNEWIQQFNKKAATLANDPVMKDTKISIELFCVGKGSKGEDEPNILGHFWNRIESFFFSKTHKKTEQDIVTQEIQKLLSYKTESGWAVLSKGSRLVVNGNGSTMLKVLEEFDKKKELVREMHGTSIADVKPIALTKR